MYELRPPTAELSTYIDNYWFVTSTPRDPVDLRVDVFVDGRSDLIFNFGAASQREVIGGPTREIAASNLDAQRLHPIRITQRGLVRRRRGHALRDGRAVPRIDAADDQGLAARLSINSPMISSTPARQADAHGHGLRPETAP